MKQRILGLLGLVNHGKALVIGDSVYYSLGLKKVHLVIVASDAGPNSAKKARDKTTFYNCTLISFATKDELGHAIGRNNVAVIGVTDIKIANRILTLMKDGEI